MLLNIGIFLVITAILAAAFIGYRSFSNLQNFGSKGLEKTVDSHIGSMKKMIPVAAAGVLGMVLIFIHIIVRVLG
jgi:hypothetical protein